MEDFPSIDGTFGYEILVMNLCKETSLICMTSTSSNHREVALLSRLHVSADQNGTR